MVVKRQWVPRTDRRMVGLLVVFAALAYILISRKSEEENAWQFHGSTMGTFYGVQVVGAPASRSEIDSVRQDVESLLARITSWMSTFEPSSEISRFNTSPSTDPFHVSGELALVAGFALGVAEKSAGAFDPTVAPLVDLWGFGKKGRDDRVPDRADIERVTEHIGFKHLNVPSSAALRKDDPEVELDLSAVAKGYGVDLVADLLMRRGYADVLVDIGGEIVARGNSGRGMPWRISVEVPSMDAGFGRGHYKVLSLDNSAVATSGDYRNYFKDQGRAYSHIMDPRTGWPVSNNVAAVTVIAPRCMTADALATALTVLGPERGLELLKEYRGAEAMLILRHDNGEFSHVMSQGFARYLTEDCVE